MQAMQQTGSATNAHKQPVSWMRLVEKGRHSANNRAQVCEDSKPPKPHNLKATLQCLVQHHIHYNCSNLENAKSSRSVSTSTSKRLHLALSSSCTQVPFTNRDDNTLFRRQAFQSSPTPPTPSAPPPPHPPTPPLRPPPPPLEKVLDFPLSVPVLSSCSVATTEPRAVGQRCPLDKPGANWAAAQRWWATIIVGNYY